MEQYDPYKHAADLGIRVETQSLRSANGLWFPDRRLIIIRSGMRKVFERSALAHELGHVYFGHRDDRPKHERQADYYAANNLIDAGRFAEIADWASDEFKLAAELDVSLRILRAYLAQHRPLTA